MKYTRRDFFCQGLCLASLALAGRTGKLRAAALQPGDTIPIKEALNWESLPGKRVECKLCPKQCKVDDLERGYCGVRENVGGKYYTHVYAAPCAVHTDPIEKKPLFHFLPGTTAFSIATAGCNMDCAFCQNWEISQTRPEQVQAYYMPPREVGALARRARAASIAYTYSEPVVFQEYVYDSAVAGKEQGIRSVMVSNGYIQEKPLRDLCAVLDAIKIDLKSFREKYYKEICAAELKPVLDSLEIIRDTGLWLEIVYLMVPTLNDSAQEIEELCAWVVDKLGPEVPLHFTRFHPMYRLNHLPQTPVPLLERALRIARAHGLKYVYLGNVMGHESESTRCPGCRETVIRRVGFSILDNKIIQGKCASCGQAIAGVWT